MSTPAVLLDSVQAAYGPRVIWRELSLAVAPGELIVVLGGNGSGKTTLLRLLLGQLTPSAGRVEVLGQPARRGNPAIGYVPQHRSFEPGVPLRGVDLVGLGLDGHRWGPRHRDAGNRARVQRALQAAEAEHLALAPVGRLSGGEQQRLRVAQALVGDPELLLADEPLLSLDMASQHNVAGLLEAHRTRSGAAVVVVTHDINPFLPFTDRVLYLAAGRWAAGSVQDVMTSEKLSELYGLQVDVVRVRDRLVVVGASDDAHEHLHQGHS